MAETLLTPSSIKLYGRVMTGIAFTNNTTPFGGNFFLQRQLAINSLSDITSSTIVAGALSTVSTLLPAGIINNLTVGMAVVETGAGGHLGSNTVITSVDVAGNAIGIYPPATAPGAAVSFTASITPTLARIYSFSSEGAYFELPRPPVFLVHGPGRPVGNWMYNSSLDQAGVAARDWEFSGNHRQNEPIGPNALVYWEYEKGDFSLRLDLDAGPFEQILLQMALRSSAGVSGAGVSGAGVSGAGVSGAGVSGAGVSGAGVSGAGVSGAGVRR
jgi:hypothetical protein